MLKNNQIQTSTQSESFITNIQDNVLQIIEKSLIEGNKNILSFSQNLRNEILKVYSLSTIQDIIKTRILQKKINFIRHAEAEHNSSADPSRETKQKIKDSEITLKGIEQAEIIGKALISEIPDCSLIYISPLKRALQTFTCFSKLFQDKPNVKYIVTDLIREPLTPLSKNIGMELPKLKAYINEDIKQNKIDTSFMTKTHWWTDDDTEIHESELKITFHWRLSVFLLWLLFRKENEICIISHSKVSKNITNSGIKNGKMKDISQSTLYKRCILFMTEKINLHSLK